MENLQNCMLCEFETNSENEFLAHFSRKKHKEIIANLSRQNSGQKICEYCGSIFKHSNNFYRHRKSRCTIKNSIQNRKKQGKYPQDTNNNLEIIRLEHENEKLKMEMKYQEELSREKEKNTQTQMKYQEEVINTLKSYHEQASSNIHPGVTVNCQQNIAALITGNKKDNLNRHLDEVLDLDTFTENYKNKFSLSYDETRSLLQKYHDSGLKSYVPDFFSCLQSNYKSQVKKIFDYEHDPETVLPFLSSDNSLRTYFEKTQEGWKRSSDIDKIKKLIIISNDQIYKHHSQIIPITPYERQVIANALLRNSTYDAAEVVMKKKITGQINKSITYPHKAIEDKLK